MCQPASFVVTKTAVFYGSKSESHEDIIEEHGLENLDREINLGLVHVEITPPGGNFAAPLEQWQYQVDQDLLPEWYNAADVEDRVRAKLPKWASEKIVLANQIVEKANGHIIAVYGTVQKVLDGGTVQEVWGGGTVQEVWGGGTVQKVLDGGTVQKVWGDGTVQKVLDGGTVQKVLGGGTVQEVWGGGTVQSYTESITKGILHGRNAVLIDRSGERVVCYIGEDEE